MFSFKTLTCFLFVSNQGFAFFNNNFKISNSKRRAVDQPILRIQDGEDDTNNEFPYVASLGAELTQELFELHVAEEIRHLVYKEFIQTCSGSVIADQWVLTAAHCGNPTKIRYGNMNVPPNHTLASYSKILKYIPHPAFKADVFKYKNNEISVLNNDIALLRIEKVRLDVFGRVLMADYKTLVGLPVTFLGFGLTHRDHMKSANYALIPRSRKIGRGMVMTCDKKFRTPIPSLCLVSKCSTKMQVALPADSGGPILQSGRIVGVMSTLEMGSGNSYNTLTPVSPYLDWMWLAMRTNN